MDVDKLFKLPALPASAGQKRKFADAPTPGKHCEGSLCRILMSGTHDLEMLKKYRAAETDPAVAADPLTRTGKSNGRAATVSEEGEEDGELTAQGRP